MFWIADLNNKSKRRETIQEWLWPMATDERAVVAEKAARVLNEYVVARNQKHLAAKMDL